MIESVNAARKHFGQPIVIESGKKMELWTAERKRQLEEKVQALLSLEVNWHTHIRSCPPLSPHHGHLLRFIDHQFSTINLFSVGDKQSAMILAGQHTCG